VGPHQAEADVTLPVVIDTDIGTDIDDTWALALAARSPELDVRLVTTVSGDPMYRARVTRGLLGPGVRVAAGRGGGRDVHPGQPQAELAASGAAGPIEDDGVAALVEACAGDEPVTIIALGPLTNLAAALEVDPTIAGRARVVAMLGSVRLGYRGAPEPAAEYNVHVDVPACRAVLAAPWSVTITPLDTCGTILLRGDRYQRVLASPDALTGRVLATYREWLGDANAPLYDRRSTTLYDCVAIHLAHDESLHEIEELPLAVDDDGLMRVEQDAPVVRVATRWRDEEAFLDHVVTRLT
jgi:inosine-uridine nucleoside N-ribohydrolase